MQVLVAKDNNILGDVYRPRLDHEVSMAKESPRVRIFSGG